MTVSLQFQRSEDYARSHEQELREKYGNDCLAIFGEYVLDHDEDRNTLIERVYSRSTYDVAIMFMTLDEIINPKAEVIFTPGVSI